MSDQPKVYIHTRAYNAEKTIRRTIESVLAQTWPHFIYVIQDNGSTDQTTEICREYARKDSRIILVRNEINNVFDEKRDQEVIRKVGGLWSGADLGENDFFCLLDADDEYLPDFFERAVQFAQTRRLDIVVGGTEMLLEDTGAVAGTRAHENNLYISGENFSQYFLRLHWHLRQVWGKLFRRHVLFGFNEYWTHFLQKTFGTDQAAMPYGADTVNTLYYFRQAERVGVLSGCSHRYYIQKRSVSSVFQQNRVESDQILHDATADFLLAKCGQISQENNRFLQIVYANAVADTLGVVGGSNLTPAEKLREYAKIAVRPVTLAVYRQNKDDSVTSSRSLLLRMALKAGLDLKGRSNDDLRTVVQTLLPRCGPIVTGQNLPVIVQDQPLLQPFLADEPEPVLRRLLRLIAEKYGVKKYNLVEMAQTLAADNPLLSRITDTAFLRRYGDIYLSVWRGEYYETLDEMTGLLLDNQVNGGKKAFLELYISLAAALSQESAFIFGKLQLAALLLKQGDLTACRAVVTDLEEMGLTDNEELDAIRYNLEKQI